MSPITLTDCFAKFSKDELLVGEDMWHCPKCNQKREARKKLEICRLPKVLIIHIKRFKEKRYQMQKDEALVNFPLEKLDMQNHVPQGFRGEDPKALQYELLGVCNHSGGLDGGHYTACIKYKTSNHTRWIKFDDHYVSPVEEKHIVTPEAYVLFYKHSSI